MRPRVVIAAASIGLLTIAYRYLSFTEFSNDHFVHLSLAQQVTRGALPVRDFVERGLPLMSLLSAAGQAGLGEGLRSELFVIALAFGLAAALTCAAAIQFGRSTTVAVLAAVVPVLAYPVSYAYPKLLAPAVGFAAACWYVVQPTTQRAVLLALAIVMAFLLRHDLGVVLGTGAVAMMVARHGGTRESLAAAGRLVALTALIASPYALWVQVHQGVVTYVGDGLAFSRREAQRANWWWEAPPFGVDAGRPLFTRLGRGPVVNVRWQSDASDARVSEAEARHGLVRLELNSPRSWQYELRRWSPRDIESLVKDPIAADTQGIDRASYRLQVPAPTGLRAALIHLYGPGDGLRLRANATAALFYLVWICPVAAALALATTWSGSPPATRALVTMAVVVQLVMNATMLRDPLETRVRDVLVPAALLMAYFGGLGWRAAPGASRAQVVRRLVVVAALVLVVGGMAAVGDAAEQVGRTNLAQGVSGVRQRMRSIRRVLSPPDHRTGRLPAGYRPLVDYITRCTRADARLLTLTFAPELSFYTAREFAGGQVSLSPGYFTGQSQTSRLVQRVSSERVPLVIMDSQTQQEMLEAYPAIGAYIRAHYAEVARFPLTPEKAFVVLGVSGATSAVTIGDQQLPCFVEPQA